MIETGNEPTFSPTTQALLQHEFESLSELREYEQRLRQRLEALKMETEALERRRNVISLPNFIAPELLAHIFLTLIHQLNEAAHGPVKVYDLSWLKIMLVCRHWRTVAVECAALWRYIPFNHVNPRLVKLMLNRSRNGPFFIQCKPPPTKFVTIPGMIYHTLAKAELLASVELVGAFGELMPDLPTVLHNIATNGAPHLHRFVVRYIPTGYPPLLPRCKLPAEFAAEWAPSLRVMALENINWEHIPFMSTLRELDLRTGPSWTTQMPVEVLLERLNNLPCLEVLILWEVIALSNAVYSTDTGNKTLLPNLDQLTIRGPTTTVHGFFASVEIPDDCVVRIMLSDERPPDDGIDKCFRALKASWTYDSQRHPKKRGVYSLKYADAPPQCFVHRGCSILLSFRDSLNSEPVAQLELAFQTRDFRPERRFFASIDKHFDLSSLVELHLSNNRFVAQPLLKETFGRLRQLCLVSIKRDSIDTFLGVLAEPPDLYPLANNPTAGSGAPLPFFPGLREIRFFSVIFKPAEVNIFLGALKSRPQTHRVQRLVMEDSKGFTDMNAVRMRSLIPDLELRLDNGPKSHSGMENVLQAPSSEDSSDESEEDEDSSPLD